MESKQLTPWQRFVGLLKLEKKDIFQIFYYAVFGGLVALSLPLGIQAIINLIQGAQISTSWIVLVILVTIGVIFSGALQLMQLRIIETIQQRIFTRASFELSYRFPKIKMNELRNDYPPELANRFFDTLTIQKGLSKILIDVPTALLQIIFALILLSFYHAFFIVFGILLLLLIYIVFKFTAQKGLETSLIESKKKYKVAHWIQEVARALVSFKLSGNTNLALQKNDNLVSNYLEARENHFKILMLQFIQMIGFKVIVTASLLLIGGALVLNQEMNIGQFVAAEIIILLVIQSVEKLIIGLESFYDVLTSIEKIGQVVDKELEAQEGDKPIFKDGLTVELEGVSFGVENREKHIIKNVSFTLKPKSRILIMGESGAGKSTLLHLIAGIMEPTSGNIYINNLSLSSLHLNHYRSQLGLSLSDETPFEGSIKNNLVFGNKEIKDEAIYEALEIVGLTQFLKEQPKGLETVLYPEGKQMSYTIAKKLILARAIIKKPKIMILEDPLDQFNLEETVRIINYLTDAKRPWALIVASSKKSWRTQSKETIILEKGEIKSIN
ncbi:MULTISPECIES: peptidase domain-containing ABC transporter [unclassified Polaribacter]|jgi:ABC-type bacteriocin/lantibiotic exporter with double-glycine peptidase domain|uniref:peptidase domain-containing ABC transporter n=1 Tax=unclassified Polaribacter TaxID=196858 RepID=UPI001C4E4816|nr:MULTISPECIES: ATP-binding cassette domain-containing protein [unclassified Polaribacter]QXP62299.1 ATP-binding cassette domain-containing protein [Polaribacter sp. HaHaR_3_91]QXP68053.1 ATP-binding cassette domain-containing protein [Polaribacter sp. AHE13PA]QXP70225.1 ATP-binding cassette domain-containing protein [Polaribacter sp. R2A056_3_33]